MFVRDLVHLYRQKYCGSFDVHVACGGSLYIAEVNELGCRPESRTVALTHENSCVAEECPQMCDLSSLLHETAHTSRSKHVEKDNNAPETVVDPLLNPPKAELVSWEVGLLVLVPLKLGESVVNNIYCEVVDLCFYWSFYVYFHRKLKDIFSASTVLV